METLSDGYVPKFTQDRFAIGFWVDPPADANMDRHYADIAGANFTMVLGGFGAGTPETVRRQIGLCEKYGLKAIVSRAGLPPEKLPADPVVWGYAIRDEPNAKDFPALRETLDAIRNARPGKLGYINLFPNYANEAAIGDEDVRRTRPAGSVRKWGVDVLSNGPLPVHETGGRYAGSLLREPRRDAEVRPRTRHPLLEFLQHDALRFPFRSDGGPAPLADLHLHRLRGEGGPLLLLLDAPRRRVPQRGRDHHRRRQEDAALRAGEANQLGSEEPRPHTDATDQHRASSEFPPEDDRELLLKETPIASLTKGDYLIGTFRHADGRRAVLLNNYHFAYTAWPTVQFAVPAEQVREICKETGKEVPVVDDSP